MHTIIFTIIILALVNPPELLSAQGPEPNDSGNRGTLNVEVRGFRNLSGTVQLTLFKTAEGFPNNSKLAYKTASVPISEGIAVIILDEIPFGFYAVGVFHDENSNKKMDANFLGAPKEGYGASNDARGILSPPSFEDAKFFMNSEKLKITIMMVYRD